MRLKFAPFALCSATAVFAGSAIAGDVALLLVNEHYDNAPVVADASQLLSTRLAFENAGFRVVDGEGLTLAQAQEHVADAVKEMGDADRIVVVLAGQMAHSNRDAWLLAKDASLPEGYTVGTQGLSLGALMDLSGQARVSALVMVTTTDDPVKVGLGLAAGPGLPDVPDGVTFVSGPAGRLERLLSMELLQEGQTIRAVLSKQHSGIRVAGDLPDAALFPGTPPEPDDGSIEEGYWRAASHLDTIAAYLAYIDQFPRGLHLTEARQRIADLRAEPTLEARRTEDALGLTPSARQAIQRNLSILGYDTRGIDGIFGPGTRSAIISWQQAERLNATGYVTRDQIATLKIAAELRARELEEAAARRQAEQDRKDRAFWHDIVGNGGEAELRAYLKAFPDGLYADVAQQRLNRIEDARHATAEAQERLLWDKVRAENTVKAYRSYLDQYPKGSFAKTAQARIDALLHDDQNQTAIEAAMQEEKRIAGSSVARLMVEQRLESLGLKPGAVDGNFTASTRAALRRYQSSRGLIVTGYLDQATMIRLLAGQ